MTAEEAQALIQQEQVAHQEALQKLLNEEVMLKAVLREQEASFVALITRVTDLRVAKGEYMANKEESFDTGSPVVNRVLEGIQEKLQSTTEVGGTLLNQLSEAASAAMTPFYPNSVNFKNEEAARVTGIAIVTRSDLRGARSWGKRHISGCPQCSRRVAQLTPRWERYRYEDKRTGLAAAALSAGAPQKKGYRCNIQVVRDRSMRERAAADERRVDVFRSTIRLHITSRNDQPLPSPQATADTISTFASKWADRSLSLLREKAADLAPWNAEGTANPSLSAAVAMLLHAFSATVSVKCVSNADLSAAYRVVQQQNPQKPPFTPLNASAFDLSLSVSMPVQVASLSPLIELLEAPEQRRYLVDHLIAPLAAKLGAAIDMAELVSRYVTVALNTLDSLHRMAGTHGLLSSSDPPAAASGGSQPLAKRDTTSAKLYRVLLALAVFDTSVEVEVAVPTMAVDADKAAALSPAERAKALTLRLAKAFLRNLRTRTPFEVPPLNDPECADVVCRIVNTPTTFLEILNRTFNSNERLPSTSRSSALDLVITPKAKLSLGLKLYSELCIEVYRPFDEQRTAGAVLASQNGASGRPKAPACVPVVDMPVDVVTANAAVSAYSEHLNDRLTELEGKVRTETQVEQDSKVVLEKLAGALGQSEPYQQWKEDLQSMDLEVKQVSQVSVEVLIPFGIRFIDPRESMNHLLYLRVEGAQSF